MHVCVRACVRGACRWLGLRGHFLLLVVVLTVVIGGVLTLILVNRFTGCPEVCTSAPISEINAHSNTDGATCNSFSANTVLKTSVVDMTVDGLSSFGFHWTLPNWYLGG